MGYTVKIQNFPHSHSKYYTIDYIQIPYIPLLLSSLFCYSIYLAYSISISVSYFTLLPLLVTLMPSLLEHPLVLLVVPCLGGDRCCMLDRRACVELCQSHPLFSERLTCMIRLVWTWTRGTVDRFPVVFIWHIPPLCSRELCLCFFYVSVVMILSFHLGHFRHFVDVVFFPCLMNL